MRTRFEPRPAGLGARRCGAALWLGAALSLTLASACKAPRGPVRGADGMASTSPAAVAWPEADVLFHRDPRWLGADAAYSAALDQNRVLWLFGDTIVATSPAVTRSESTMIHNSVAVQDGRDPRTASMRFFWNRGSRGEPSSFIADRGGLWDWPAGAVKVPAGLILFTTTIRATPGRDLGFAFVGWRIGLVRDASGDPDAWSIRWIDPPGFPFDGVVSAAAALDTSGSTVVLLVARAAGAHPLSLARLDVEALLRGVVALDWWDGARWVPQARLAKEPAVVLAEGSTESSLFPDVTGGWHYHATRGFGATTIAASESPRLEGPWAPLIDLFRPPESDRRGTLVYAAKAHPELIGLDARDLVLTYATNTQEFGTLFEPEAAGLYWPRFVRVPSGR